MTSRNAAVLSVLIVSTACAWACSEPDTGGEVRIICVTDACQRERAERVEGTEPTPDGTASDGGASSSSH